MTAWPSTNGAYLGNTFLPPHLNGTLRLSNPGETVVTVRGGVEYLSSRRWNGTRSWPPAYDDGAATLDADGDVFDLGNPSGASIDGTNGTMLLPADDTGALSGGLFSYGNTLNTTEERCFFVWPGTPQHGT